MLVLELVVGKKFMTIASVPTKRATLTMRGNEMPKDFLEDILENFDEFFEFIKHISATHTEEECKVIMDKMFETYTSDRLGIDLSKPPKKNKT